MATQITAQKEHLFTPWNLIARKYLLQIPPIIRLTQIFEQIHFTILTATNLIEYNTTNFGQLAKHIIKLIDMPRKSKQQKATTIVLFVEQKESQALNAPQRPDTPTIDATRIPDSSPNTLAVI